MADALTVYFDYTCGYSYKALGWLDRVHAVRPELAITWATFSLKEVNRPDGEPSYLEAGSSPSLSVLALALAHAARDATFDPYHRAAFEAFHTEDRRLAEGDLLSIAAGAGVDLGSFEGDRGAWIARVGAEHRGAVTRWGAYGTPTIVVDGAAAFVRLGQVPPTEEAAVGLVDALGGIAGSSADLVEVFRPEGPKPTPISLGGPFQDGGSAVPIQ